MKPVGGPSIPEIPPLPDAAVQDVIIELLACGQSTELAERIARLANTRPGAELICQATLATARILLCAKTVLPSGWIRFEEVGARDLRFIREHDTLVALSLALIDEEARTEDDIFRDRTAISDAEFSRRLGSLRRLMRH